MIREEAIESLKSDLEVARYIDSDFVDCVEVDAIRVAVKALEKAEKYRWHDLRKNPNDLPKNEAEYLVKIDCENGTWYEVAHFENDSLYNNLNGEYMGDASIAWKEIETFEVEE